MEQKDTNTGANANANANLPYGAQDPEAVSKKDKALIVTILIILLIIAGLAVIGFLCIKPQPDTIQGHRDPHIGQTARTRTRHIRAGRSARACRRHSRTHCQLARRRTV